MESISTWLNGPRNYEQGVKIYNEFGTSDAMKAVFGFGNTSFNRTKLAELLEELLPAPEPAKPAIAVTHPLHIIPDTISLTSGKRSEETQLSEQWKPLYKDAAFMHGQLSMATTDDDRKQLAFSILDNFEKMEGIWDQEEYLKQHGHLPPSGTTPEISSLDSLGKYKRLKNLRTYVTKHKNNPKRAADVVAWETEVRQLEEELK